MLGNCRNGRKWKIIATRMVSKSFKANFSETLWNVRKCLPNLVEKNRAWNPWFGLVSVPAKADVSASSSNSWNVMRLRPPTLMLRMLSTVFSQSNSLSFSEATEASTSLLGCPLSGNSDDACSSKECACLEQHDIVSKAQNRWRFEFESSTLKKRDVSWLWWRKGMPFSINNSSTKIQKTRKV